MRAGARRGPTRWLPLLLALGACAEPPAPPTLTVRALYVGPLYDGQAMQTDHEAVPGRMPAMRMAFRVRDPSALDGVPPGPVALTLDSASLVVVGVAALPAGTALDLDPGDGGRPGGIVLPSE